jgi:tetratricopeptide (TPR) repeat protein
MSFYGLSSISSRDVLNFYFTSRESLLEVTQRHCHLAEQHHAAGQFGTAIYLYEEACDTYKLLFGPRDVTVGYCHNNIGKIHEETQNFAESLKAYDKAIAIFNELDTDTKPRVLGVALHNRAKVSFLLKGPDAAYLDLYTALDCYKQIHGANYLNAPEVKALQKDWIAMREVVIVCLFYAKMQMRMINLLNF